MSRKSTRARLVAFPTSLQERRKILRNSPNKRLRRIGKAQAFVGWLFVICTALFVLMNYTLFTPKSLSQIAVQVHAVATMSNSEAAEIINFPSGRATDTVLYDNGLAVIDTDTLYILQAGGLTRMTQQLSYTSPTLVANDRIVLVYDSGGTALCLSNGISVVAEVVLDSPIVSASLGKNGGVAVVTDENGYKSAVTVFSEDGKQRFKWSTSDYYISHAALSANGSELCVLGYRQENTVLVPKLFFFDLSRDTIKNEIALDDTIGYALAYLSDTTVALVADNAAYVADATGWLNTLLEYSAHDLINFEIHQNGVLLTTRAWHSNARAQVQVFNRMGNETCNMLIHDEPQSISYTGRRIAVLSASGLTFYELDGTPIWKNTAASGAGEVLTTNAGDAWVIFGKSALFISQNHDASEDILTS